MVAVGLMHSYLSHRDIIDIPLQHKVPTQTWVEEAVNPLHPLELNHTPLELSPASHVKAPPPSTVKPTFIQTPSTFLTSSKFIRYSLENGDKYDKSVDI